jgi:hypothetical protein
MLETSACKVWRGLPDYLLDSQDLVWLVPGMVLGMATTLLYFTWLLSFPMWGDVDRLVCRLYLPMECG